MKKLLLVLIGTTLLGAALAQPPFVDIPPCHWAADAVADIAGQPHVDLAQARTSIYLVQNSLRQVFEGLKCQDPAWSSNFLTGAPAALASAFTPTVAGFDLRVLRTTLTGNSATVAFELTLKLSASGAPQTYTRHGQAKLSFADGNWRVAYDSLAALELPVFPR